MKKHSSRSGMTVLEIVGLVVIFFLVVVTVLLYISRSNAENRDLIRENDLATIEEGLQMYHYNNNNYPQRDSGANVERDNYFQEQLADIKLSYFQDPRSGEEFSIQDRAGQYSYFYRTVNEGEDYCLWAPTEIGNEFKKRCSQKDLALAWSSHPQPQEVVYEGEKGLESTNKQNLASNLINTPESTWFSQANRLKTQQTSYGEAASLSFNSLNFSDSQFLNIENRADQKENNIIGYLEKNHHLSFQEGGVSVLTADDEYTYFVFKGQPLKIARVPHGQFNQVELKIYPQEVGEVKDLLIGEDYLYLISVEPARILKINRDDLSLADYQPIDQINKAQDFTLGEQNIYGGSAEKDLVWEINKNNFQVTEIPLDISGYKVNVINNDKDYIYVGLFKSTEDPGIVVQITKSNYDIKTKELKEEENEPVDIINDEAHIYVALGGAPPTIVRLSKEELTPVSKKADTRDGFIGLTQSDNYVYGITKRNSNKMVFLNKDDLSIYEMNIVNSGNNIDLIRKASSSLYLVSSASRQASGSGLFGSSNNKDEVKTYYLTQAEGASLIKRLSEKIEDKFIETRIITSEHSFRSNLGETIDIEEDSDFIYFIKKTEYEDPYLIKCSKNDLSRVKLFYFPREIKNIKDTIIKEEFLYVLYGELDFNLMKINTDDFSSFSLKVSRFLEKKGIITNDDQYIYLAVDSDPLDLLKINQDNFKDVTTSKPLEEISDLKKMIYKDGFLYLGFNTQPARLVKIDSQSLEMTEKNFLSSGNNHIADLIADDKYIYIGLQQSPGRVLKVDQETLETVDNIVFRESFNKANALTLKDDQLQVALQSDSARIVTLDKNDLSVLYTRPLTNGKDKPNFISHDDHFIYSGLSTSTAVGLSRMLDFNFEPETTTSKDFYRDIFLLKDLPKEVRQENIYNHFFFTPRKPETSFRWDLAQINLTK